MVFFHRKKRSQGKNDRGRDVNSPIDTLLEKFKNSCRYHPLSLIGEGGRAKVCGSFDLNLNRIVAVKELKEQSLKDYYLVQSFLTEARLTGYLDHPGVVSIYDAYLRDDGTPCYTMKLIEGKSLSEILYYSEREGQGSLVTNLARYMDIFEKLCETLAYVHDRGVIHLDLKPDNIMIGSYGEVVIMDWGNARFYDLGPFRRYVHQLRNLADKLLIEEVQQDGFIVGTPSYMSPEQTRLSRDRLTPSSDIFSLGIILYEMLTGRHPFPAGTTEEVIGKICGFSPAAPDSVNREIPRKLSQICMKMLEKDVENRYMSFHEVMRDIDALSSSGQAFVTRTIDRGKVICREGDIGTCSFTILRGSVEISKMVDGRKKVLAVLGEGEVVGELAVFTNRPRTATVTTLEPTTIRIMHRADIDAELEKLSPWVGRMIQNLSERFIQLNDKMARE